MRKIPIIAALVMVLAVMFITGPARASDPRTTLESWVEIVNKYEGHPVAVIRQETLVFVMIYEKSESPDMDNPLALDVRTLDGVPVFFFEYEKEEAVMVWRHPAIKNNWLPA